MNKNNSTNNHSDDDKISPYHLSKSAYVEYEESEVTDKDKVEDVIHNYMQLSIVSVFFCCFPLGIVALIYSSTVNQKIQAGDLMGARKAADNAKKYATISIATIIIWMFFYFILILLGHSL